MRTASTSADADHDAVGDAAMARGAGRVAHAEADRDRQLGVALDARNRRAPTLPASGAAAPVMPVIET